MSRWRWIHSTSDNMKLDSPGYDSSGGPNNALQYNFTESSSSSPTPTLTSPSFSFSTPAACFTFRYYFLSDSPVRSNELTVTLHDENKGSSRSLWRTKGGNLDDWRNAQVQIDQPATYKVRRGKDTAGTSSLTKLIYLHLLPSSVCLPAVPLALSP